MTDSKTEWRAEPMIGVPGGKWAVWAGEGYIGNKLVAHHLDKPTALKIAAVNEMEAALVQFVGACDNAPPNNFIIEIGVACDTGRAALAKARGKKGKADMEMTHERS